MPNNNENNDFILVNKKKKLPVLKIVIAVLLFLVVIFVAFFALLPVSPSEWLGIKKAEMQSGEFPCDLSDYGTVVSVDVCSSRYIVSTESAIVDINRHGSIISSFSNSFTNCVIKCSETRFIAFDRKGKAYRVFNAMGEMFSGKTDAGIVTVSIADDGTYAILTDDNKVSVYNDEFKQIYRFTSAESLIDISVNGKSGTLAIAGVTTKDGEFTTIVQSYKFSSEQPIFKTSVQGIAYKIVQDGNDTVVVTNTCCYSLNSSGEVSNKLDYNSRLLSGFAQHSGELLLVLSAGSNSQAQEVYVLNSSLKVIAQIECDKLGSSFDFTSDCIYVMSDRLYAFDYDGKVENQYDLSSDVSDFAVNNGDIAVITYDKFDLLTK